MNVLDIIMLLCFIPAIIAGIRKGFIAQVISIISIISGIWLSFRFSELVGGWLDQWIDASADILHVVAFAVILILVIIGFSLLGRLLEATIKIILLGWLNKLLGCVFAVAKYALVIGLLIMAFDWLNNEFGLVKAAVLDQSVLYSTLLDVADKVFPYLKGLVNGAAAPEA